MAFWTYLPNSSRADFHPYYGDGPGVSESVLVGMLDHLSWEAPEEQALTG